MPNYDGKVGCGNTIQPSLVAASMLRRLTCGRKLSCWNRTSATFLEFTLVKTCTKFVDFTTRAFELTVVLIGMMATRINSCNSHEEVTAVYFFFRVEFARCHAISFTCTFLFCFEVALPCFICHYNVSE